MSREAIAEELLGCRLETAGFDKARGGFAPCPGRDLHSKKNGRRDFRVVLDGAPTGYCLHSSCSSQVETFNRELRRRIWIAENGDNPVPANHWGNVAPEPKQETKARPELDLAAVEEFTRGTPAIDPGFLAARSPIEPDTVDTLGFLNAIYQPNERALIFTTQYSQGDFVFWHGRGSFRLARERNVAAVASPLPAGGKEGVWYLTQPVTAQWSIKGTRDQDTRETNGATWTRRSEQNVTAWKYFVLESDHENFEADWLRVLVSLQMPIAAIYTSGGRSIHALIRYDVPSKAHWDQARNVIRQMVCPLGADPAALTAVRLSRLPGCKRGDRLQRLLYLDPEPTHSPCLRLRPPLR